MTFRNIILGLIFILSLAACATKSSVSIQRYNLPDNTPASTQVSVNAEQMLVIGSIELAEFLDSENIILQVDDITLNQARTHLWAEDLKQQIRRGLRSRLTTQLPEMLVVTDSGNLKPNALTLQLNIEKFQGHFSGQALTSGQWKLKDSQGNLLMITPFHIETTLAADGYPALVRALGTNLDKLADQLAMQIQQR